VGDTVSDPFITELTTGMIQLHEIMVSAISAGFTEEQAFRIALQVLGEGLRRDNG